MNKNLIHFAATMGGVVVGIMVYDRVFGSKSNISGLKGQYGKVDVKGKYYDCVCANGASRQTFGFGECDMWCRNQGSEMA